MASKPFLEFLAEFPVEYRHAHPVFEVLTRYIQKIVSSGSSSSSSSNVIKLLEYGAGFGEHAVYYQHLCQHGALKKNLETDFISQDHFFDYLSSLNKEGAALAYPSPTSANAEADEITIQWQPTEVDFTMKNLTTTFAKWQSLAPKNVMKNICAPKELDIMKQDHWERLLENNKDNNNTDNKFDLILTINTFHIVSEEHGYSALEGISKVLKNNNKSYFLTYGPFKVDNKQTSESNAKFELFLKQTYSEKSGIRDIGTMKKYCEEKLGMTIEETIKMPEDNFILVFRHL